MSELAPAVAVNHRNMELRIHEIMTHYTSALDLTID